MLNKDGRRTEMDTKGLRINAAFAHPPNTLRLCGSTKAMSAMEECASGGSCEEAEKEIKSFRTLWPYLQTIADALGRDPLDTLVAESYWLGHPKVFHFKPEDFRALLRFFSRQKEIPKEYIEQLRTDPPKRFIPFHTFQVLLGAKHGGGINEASLAGINDCMVSWGRIRSLEMETFTAVVNLARLNIAQNGLYLEFVLTNVQFDPRITPNLKPGTQVAVHWNRVVKTITLIQRNRLVKATDEVLRSQNSI